jgi:hypothetical protein
VSLSYADRIRSAPGLPDAMLILAEGIDAILATLDMDAKAPDPWSDAHWGPFTHPGPPPDDEPELIVRDEAAISATREALAAATDPDDIRALTARLELLQDDGQPLDIAPQAGKRAVVTEDLVELPAVTPERKQARYEWALRRDLAGFLGIDEAPEAYAKGGPEWLYANRDAVMQMPIDWRCDLITDLELDSPAAAQEMARDILKVETEDPRD